MLTPYLPYPPSSGGQIRTYNLLKYLSQKHKITLISLYKFEYEREYVQYLKKYCHEIYLCKRAENPWQLKNISGAIFSAKPFLIVRNFSEQAKETAEKLLKKEVYDVIHAETFYIMPHLPKTTVPIVLVEQTIEYKVYQHFVKTLPIFIQPLFYMDILKLIYWERFYWQKASLVAAVSEEDRKKIISLEKNINPVTIPNGAGDDMLQIPLRKKNLNKAVILFIGNFYWLQNVEAATILIKEIYPLIKQIKNKKIKLVVAGQNAKNKLKYQSTANMEIVNIEPNDIKTVKKLYQEATVFASPIYGPGGTRLKILAAMAAGLPIISTTTGVEGLGLENKKNVLLANNPEQFANEIKEILNNQKLFNQIQKNAYNLVRETYSWKSIAKKLEAEYKKIRT